VLAATLAIFGLVLAQFAWVRPTNFGGYDEWLILWLSSKGLVSQPHANRPFNLVWTVPGWWLSPDGILGYHALHALYLALSGVAVLWLVRRLLPGDPLLAWLAGVFAACWAPSDMGRLSSVQMCMYSGSTLGSLAAVVLLVESWRRGSRVLLALSVVLSWATVRGYEATLPVLLAAALAIRPGQGGPRASRALWTAAWTGGLLVATAAVIAPLVAGRAQLTYQSEVWGGTDLHPVRILGRLARQYALHLAPALAPGWVEIRSEAAWLSGAVFLLGVGLVRPLRAAAGEGRRSKLLAIAGAGLVLAGLGYGTVVLSAADVGPTRMQFLSAPGIALFLAAVIRLLAGVAPARCRPALAVLLATWVATVAGGRTWGMQRAWDAISAYPAQRDTLAQLATLLPDLEPGTLVVLADESRSWPTTFGFRHAVELLYEGRATGYVQGAWDLLYPTRLGAEGVTTVPWPSLQRSWGERPSFHPFGSLLVVRLDSRHRLSLIETWPESLPAAGGASYDPARRIVPLRREIPARALLVPPQWPFPPL
jgi:hypothetical protein